MKFYWKIFYIFINLIVAVFAVFGLWMVFGTVQASLDREVAQANTENQMYQFAFETTIDTVSATDEKMRNKAIVEIARSLGNSLEQNNVTYALYSDRKELLYVGAAFQVMNLPVTDLLNQTYSGYQLMKSGGKYYLVITYRTDRSWPAYYLVSIKDISHIYMERHQMLEKYQMAMVGLIVVTAAATLIVTHFLTSPIVQLSRTARKLSNGDYSVRAACKSQDEIGRLTGDFNRMADQLEKHVAELSQAVRRQEDFTASFAHELKTPLTSVIGYADMLRRMDMTPEEIVEASNYIYSQGRRLESLSFKLLELMTTDKQNYTMNSLPVKNLMQELTPVVIPSLRERHIHLHISIKKGFIVGEKDLLMSLFINLIDNARKALPDGGHVWLQGEKQEQGYSIRVIDNGRGIPQEELSKITEAFYMVDKSRARKEGGAGIGMALCKKIVELHNAQWKIESREGIGTVVSILFPETEVENA